MKRSKPLKRTGFVRPTREQLRAIAEQLQAPGGIPHIERFTFVTSPLLTPLHRGTYARSKAALLTAPKEGAIQHEGYMAVVRRFACARCFRPGPSQFCHGDEGKGGHIKTDCRRGWPGCPPCHEFVGMTGKLGKEGRRAFEEEAARRTRALVLVRGEWPDDLPLWPDDTPFAALAASPGDDPA